MNILALDVGTSAVKAAVLEVATGKLLGPMERSGYALDAPVPGAAELPAKRLWPALAQAARAAIVNTDVSRQSIAAVGLTTMMPALVLLDRHDQPLTPIWTHHDQRGRAAARSVWASAGKEFLQTVGNRPLPGGISVLSYRQQCAADPHLAARVRSYLHVNGWLAFHLTGNKYFDRANACFTGLFGTLTDQQWSHSWCKYFHVDPAWLPPVVCGTTTAGTLRPAIAAELGLAQIPVKLGTADTSSAMLAAGMQRGDLLHVVGARQVLVTIAEKPRPSLKHLTRLLGVGDEYIHIAHNPVGGTAIDWVRQLCFREQTEREFYEKTLLNALERDTSVKLDPPYLSGDRLDIEPRHGGFRALELTTDRLDLLAAVLDAIVENHYDAVKALGQGSDFQRVFLTGSSADLVQLLIPDYQTGTTEMLEEGPLHGVAKLFTR